MKKVAIIGAGTSGLAAIKCCLDEGIEPVCYEKTSDIGGLWCFREGKEVDGFETSTVFRSTVTNISKEIMAFSDFPMPKEYPNYLHNSYLNRYLNLYADNFKLKRHVVFNTNVKLVSPADDYDTTGRWKVELEKKEANNWTEIFDAVLVCNGHDVTPNLPELSGMEEFQGEILHSRYYKRPTGYEDKRILVIGMGNSACDAAAELARVADRVFMSTRVGTWVLSRLSDGGLPIDIFAIRRVGLMLPDSLMEWKLKKSVNSRLDHTIHPLKPKHGFFSKGIVLNDELPYQIVNGNIVIKPDVKRFTKSGVEFEDGTYEDIDCVILATGYHITFPIESSLVSVERNRVNLYRNMFPPDLKHPTLAIIGLTQQAGPVNPISEMQCRWATRLIKGICKLPPKEQMMLYIKKYKENLKRKLVESPRTTISVDYIPYLDEIASEIGAKPNLRKLFFRDPSLALQCFFGPCYSYQYRLVGPGKWDGAKEAIGTAWDRITGAYQTRKVPEDNVSNATTTFVTLGLAALFTGIIYMTL